MMDLMSAGLLAAFTAGLGAGLLIGGHCAARRTRKAYRDLFAFWCGDSSDDHGQ